MNERNSMGEKWQCPSKVVLDEWVAECMAVYHKLDDWSQTFIKSIENQLTYKVTLSYGQVQKLEQIYVEYTR